MGADRFSRAALGDAMAPMPAGPLLRLSAGAIEVDLAPAAGGRIACIRVDGIEQLIGPGDEGWPASIAWGCYPMVPWAGRIRDGRFRFDGREVRLQRNFGNHAIHGLGFALPWHVDASDDAFASLSLALPEDAHWPFGGMARQLIRIRGRELHLGLSVQAGRQRMPAVIGWHPWFRKPDRIDFFPNRVYPRDAEGIAVLPLVAPTPGPWDDCFVHGGPIVLHRGAQRVNLASDCSHWVVYDEPAHATCVEPQSGPPDAFNLGARVLQADETLRARFTLSWANAAGAR